MHTTHNPTMQLAATEAGALLGALDALGVAWWTKDGEGRYLRLNTAALALLGLDAQRAVGHTDAELMPAASASALRGIETSAMRLGGLQLHEPAIDLNGARKQLACATVSLAPSESSGAAWLGVWLDRSALHSRELELRSVLQQLEAQQNEHRALRAEVDGRSPRPAAVRLVQREQFEDQLSREIDLSLREHREFAVVYISIDAASPGEGDDPRSRERVLSAFDGLLRNNTRAMDAPSRLDGERFALLLSGVGLATAHARMEGLRRQCATQLIAQDGAALRFTVSMGVASYPHTSQTQAGLLGAAQGALSQAEERGGNHVALASIVFGVPPAA